MTQGLQGENAEALDAVIRDQRFVACDVGQIFNDDAAVIDRVIVVGLENGNFAKCRKGRELRIGLGGSYGFPDVLQFAGKPAFGSVEVIATVSFVFTTFQ